MQTVTIFGIALPVRDVNGTRYVAMRPLVEGHGMAWKPQFLKLKRRHGPVLKSLPFKASDGKVWRMIGAPAWVAEDWLDSVNASKVSATVRDQLDASKEADAAAKRAEAERAIINERCQRFGEEFRAAPLVPAEGRLTGPFPMLDHY